MLKKAELSTRPVVTKTDTTCKVVYRLMPSSSHNFVGRADYLAKLEMMFVGGRQAGSRPVGVLSGLGGMGKTQLSVRFAETTASL
jgi:Holliday junction resolvasome RuvABC ATP-dependent DNA helicase subunit